MTVAECMAEMERLFERSRVRPATPEYLAENQARIETLVAEFSNEFASVKAVIDNVPKVVSILQDIRRTIVFAQAIDDLQYGMGQVENHPEAPDGDRPDR